VEPLGAFGPVESMRTRLLLINALYGAITVDKEIDVEEA
jgi:hypothetical protein